MTTGTIFNIQSYSLHDGPGIRTVVFLKGCPLRCIWCSNPESQLPHPEIYFDKGKCIWEKGCSRCEGVCSVHAIQNGSLNFDLCTNCSQCAAVCPSKACSVYGTEVTVAEVLEKVERERVFYRHGKGGMTLSGGEPLVQGDFAVELLREAKRRRLHTAIETCGCCKSDDLRKAAAYLDYVMFDIKLMDEKKHIQYTGGSNRLILENIKILFEEFPHIPKRIRTPVIPTVNDTEEEIGAIREFLSPYSNFTYELLPYHRFGQNKYAMLGRNYPDLPKEVEEIAFEMLKTKYVN